MIYVFTDGEYSDYRIVGVFEGREGISMQDVLEEMVKTGKATTKMCLAGYHAKETMFRYSETDFIETAKQAFGMTEVSEEEWWVSGYTKKEVKK